ncbi:MAG: stalk domain-containing protein [Minisyncoccia bacterium]
MKFMKHKILIFLLLFFLFILFFKPYSVKADEISISIYGNNKVFLQKPIFQNDTLLVPMRPFLEALGADVDWETNTHKVTAFKDNIKIILYINNKFATVNNKIFTLKTAPRIIGDFTYIPLRFIGEAFGDDVNYSNGHIEINSKIQEFKNQNNIIEKPNNGSEISNGSILSNITTERDLYLLIKNSLEKGNEKIDLTSAKYLSSSTSSFNDLLNKISKLTTIVLEQHPEIGYTNKWTVYVNGYGNKVENVYIEFNYNFTKEQVQEMLNETKLKAEGILKNIITPDMSDIDKIKSIHDYIIKNTIYDYENAVHNTIPLDSYTAYGVLVKGVGVCQGYSAAFNLLANMAGLDCISISGEGDNQPHAWNMVRINGEVRYIDVTWDDPVPDKGDNVMYTYFNLTEKQIEKDHKWNKEDFSEKYFDYK